MKKAMNNAIGLINAMMATCVGAMGIARVNGDCADVFKIFGVLMFIAAVVGLAVNYIKVNPAE